MAAKRVAALAVAAALVAGGAGASLAGLSAEVEREPVLGYPSLSEVVDFGLLERSYACRRASGSNPALVFGSSELDPAHSGPDHPASLLAGGAHGVDVMVVGRSFCEDLWQAIEVGAFAGRARVERVVLIPSMQWFMCYRKPAQDFQAAFSEDAYGAFMENGRISDDLKARVTRRMADYGVDRREPDSPLEGLAGRIDRAAASIAASLRLSAEWDPGSASPVYGPDAPAPAGDPEVPATPGGAAPCWDEVFSRADARARERAAGNDLGIDDAWSGAKLTRWLAGAQRWRVRDGEYFSREELGDFELLLEVCREAGVEPLVLVQPVKGALYDQTVYTREVRAEYYDMVRGACERAGVAVADFSGHEYDTYFLREYSHPSDLGGAYYSKAIYRWFTEGVVDTSPDRATEGTS